MTDVCVKLDMARTDGVTSMFLYADFIPGGGENYKPANATPGTIA
jgi:hypothetical protein